MNGRLPLKVMASWLYSHKVPLSDIIFDQNLKKTFFGDGDLDKSLVAAT